MLTHTNAFSGFAVPDTAAARTFYADVLGLNVSEANGMLTITFDDGHHVLVYPKPDHQPATYTIMNFPVEDVEKTVTELAARGVEFLRYDGFPQDSHGIMRGHGPDIAWFTDPGGNVFSVLADS